MERSVKMRDIDFLLDLNAEHIFISNLFKIKFCY